MSNPAAMTGNPVIELRRDSLLRRAITGGGTDPRQAQPASAPVSAAIKIGGMKRIRVAPGKFVFISSEMAEKAARVTATGLTREQVLEFKATEPKHAGGLMAGSPKPLAIAKSRRPAR